MSLGPLVVALIFKFIKDEWDLEMCKNVVILGLISMNIAICMLTLIKEE